MPRAKAAKHPRRLVSPATYVFLGSVLVREREEYLDLV